MENKISTKYFSSCEDPTIVEYKNSIMIIFLSLIILSVLGINICGMSARVVDFTAGIFAPIFRNVLDMFGYSFGAALKHTAGDLADGAKLGVEVVGGAAEDAGEIIMEQTKKEGLINIDTFLNMSPYAARGFSPDTLSSIDPLQK
jgi:hypothetical protein